ncbi:VapD family protein [Helicobacter sp. 23-1046]
MGLDNNTDEKHIKCINFDLDTKQLREIFPDSTREPYILIKKFFEDKGFGHRQYSGYISKEPLSEYQIYRIIEELAKKFTWLRKCMQEFDISNAPDRISVKDQIADIALKQEKQNKLNEITTTHKPHRR